MRVTEETMETNKERQEDRKEKERRKEERQETLKGVDWIIYDEEFYQEWK